MAHFVTFKNKDQDTDWTINIENIVLKSGYNEFYIISPLLPKDGIKISRNTYDKILKKIEENMLALGRVG